MNKDFKQGVLMAAAVADDYNGSSTHKHRLGDCIAMKLNVVKRKRPRLNKKRIKDPSSMTRGMALALAEIYRTSRDSSAVREVARAANLTIAEMKRAGVDPYDLRALKQAGIP